MSEIKPSNTIVLAFLNKLNDPDQIAYFRKKVLIPQNAHNLIAASSAAENLLRNYPELVADMISNGSSSSELPPEESSALETPKKQRKEVIKKPKKA